VRAFLPVLLFWLASDAYSPPQVLGRLEDPRIDESSGIVASRRRPGIYWTHNDEGPPVIYAFDSRGRALGVWRVTGAANYDWEDITSGPGPNKGVPYLYIGDIGDNLRNRREVVVYRVEEPQPDGAGGQTGPATAIHLRYPDARHDAEALMVHPRSGDLYIVTKGRGAGESTSVYKLTAPLASGTLKRITTIDLGASMVTAMIGQVTGGAISPDGTRIALCGYLRGFEALLPKNRPFDDVWKSDWQPIDLGSRQQGEAICYRVDGKALVMTSEGVHSALIQIERK
jgi:hypothetical protein